MTTIKDRDRQQLLMDRKSGIGGSDVASVFSTGYGCRRRLWYDKRGVAADFPRRESGPMALGTILEPYFADHYQRITGRRVEVRGLARHPDHPELLVHVDRMIHDARIQGAGVLEIKSLGRDMFFKVRREGLPEDYVLQLQQGMLITGAQWGAFCVGSRNDGVSRDEDLLHWDIPRDEAVCQLILEEGPIFWAQVENGPAPEMLPPDDPRCGRCDWRVSCQGSALIQIAAARGEEIPQAEELRPLLAEYDERKSMADEAGDLLEESKEMIRVALVSRTAVRVGKRPIYHRPQTSMRWDADTMADSLARARGKVDYPAGEVLDGQFVPTDEAKFVPAGGLAKEFKRASVSRPLRVY